MVTKEGLRKQMKAERSALSATEKRKFDRLICSDLWQLVAENNIQVVHTFLPMGDEVNLFPFIEKILSEGLTVVAPKSLPRRKLEHLVLHSLDDLELGIYGTSHPAGGQVFTGMFDLFVVPGLAFDQTGNRVGYGAGYYDSFLSGQAKGLKMGVCYPFQMVTELPAEPHDVKMDTVLFGEGRWNAKSPTCS